MSNGQTDFQARLARLEVKNGPPAEMPGRHTSPPPKASLGLRMGVPALGLGLVAGLVMWAWPEIEPLFVAKSEDPLRNGTYLERSVLSNMTDEEIRDMNADPDLKGMTQMQKLLMSH